MKALIISVTSILVIIIIFVSLYSIPSITNIPTPNKTEIFAGEGETCSTFAYNISCKEGLVCATIDGRSKFEITKESGFCTPIVDIVDLE